LFKQTDQPVRGVQNFAALRKRRFAENVVDQPYCPSVAGMGARLIAKAFQPHHEGRALALQIAI
jgi:hypothetical protein